VRWEAILADLSARGSDPHPSAEFRENRLALPQIEVPARPRRRRHQISVPTHPDWHDPSSPPTQARFVGDPWDLHDLLRSRMSHGGVMPRSSPTAALS
jgi:hypothetical protein